MAPSKTTSEEELLTLPVGHPQAGYVGPDRSFVEGVGAFPPEEQDARDEAQAAYEEDVAAVAEAEHAVATAEREEELAPDAEPKTAAGKQRAQPIEKDA